MQDFNQEPIQHTYTSEPVTPVPPPPEPKKENAFVEILKLTLIALVIVIPIRYFIAQPFIVSGDSMVPNFHDKEYLIVDQVEYRFNEPARGDVIIFKYPKDPSRYFIKRIIGLPGETVEVRDGAVTITSAQYPNGLTLDEPYAQATPHSPSTVDLKADEYFVMGDNRPESADSRVWGALPRDNIVGRALIRLLPVGKASIFPGALSDFN